MKSGSIFIIIAAILWGLDGILRVSLYNLPPITIVFLEHLLGAIIITPFVLKKKHETTFSIKEISSLAVISLFSGVLGTLWFTTALQNTAFLPFSIVFLIQKLQPIFAATTSRLVLKEKFSINYIFWAGVAIISAFFVTFKNGIINWQTDIPIISTSLYAVGAAFAWGSSTAFSKYNLSKKSPTTITGLRFIITSIFAFIFLLTSSKLSSLSIITPSQILRVLAITFSTGLVALWLYYKGLKNTKAQISTILELAFPLTGVVIDIFLYHTILSLSQYIAAAFLIYAIYKSSKLNEN